MKSSTLLITGGTGSFGNAFLSRAIKTDNFKEIRIFSRDEKKQDDLRKKLNNPKIKFHIGDVRDAGAVTKVMKGVDYIFHAAALKQVPSCEFFPIEAIKTNVLGTENVLTAAAQEEVKKVVILSTDKAAYPINAMGMSKAMMEKVMIAQSRNLDNSKTIFCGTRYGNVMASRGSVIPIFIKLIKERKPLTITSSDMTRFMMTLDQAVELVLFAFENAHQGDLFIQKSPAATINILAQALKELFNSKVKLEEIGIRHGEKMYETLVTAEEMIKAEDLGDFYRIAADTRDLNYNKYFSEGQKKISKGEYNSNNTHQLNVEEMKELLLKLPEIQSELNG
ncbi:MAG: UDP-glucose 4-epimerase [Candidatus Endolissoclinum sp. TMED37]|nr:MAG: UDP-glucose 4-epimerase [Candidatus Endolissoclinum sp. TMED37]|tara:strand:+ start:2551 stop:3558 length:1008 start_codon:yes stop_codon:yes gene_type:complete